jgi:RNA polymerase sigma factor (sigma-70 family)
MQSYKVKDAYGRPTKIEVEVTEEAAEVLIELDRKDEVWRRKHKRRELKGVSLDYLRDEYEWETADETVDVQGAVEREDDAERVRQAVAYLNAKQQEVVRLYFYEGKTTREIAAIFGIAHSSVARQIETILKTLKKLF